MNILSRLTYSIKVKVNTFLQAVEFERRIADLEWQVDALLEMSSAKMKIQNRAAIGHLIDTQSLWGQLGITFRGHRDSGRLEPISDTKDINTSTGNFRAILQFHSMGNSELAAHLKKSPYNATYLSLDIQNELNTLIGEKILSSISSKVKHASCFAVIAEETTDKSIKSQFEYICKIFKKRYFDGTMYWYDKSVKFGRKSFSGYNLVSFEISKLALGNNDWSRQ